MNGSASLVPCLLARPSGGPTALVALAVMLACASMAEAHGVSGKDAVFLQGLRGRAIGPLLYLGAKHMVTGYDHLLFLVGVIFFLYRLKDVVQYVSLFTIGHSVTLLAGVLGGIRANPYLIDAIIGFSVVYKAFENMDGFRRFLGFQPNTRAAVLDLRPLPRVRPRHQAPGICARASRSGGQHRQLQRRRGDRSGTRAHRHPHRAHLLAHEEPASCAMRLPPTPA